MLLGLAQAHELSLQEDHSITGKFDPTALERGAKVGFFSPLGLLCQALRELDTSPNAAKAWPPFACSDGLPEAFELTKLAEQTKQKAFKA